MFLSYCAVNAIFSLINLLFLLWKIFQNWLLSSLSFAAATFILRLGSFHLGMRTCTDGHNKRGRTMRYRRPWKYMYVCIYILSIPLKAVFFRYYFIPFPICMMHSLHMSLIILALLYVSVANRMYVCLTNNVHDDIKYTVVCNRKHR